MLVVIDWDDHELCQSPDVIGTNATDELPSRDQEDIRIFVVNKPSKKRNTQTELNGADDPIHRLWTW
jgi:hypothetical protein